MVWRRISNTTRGQRLLLASGAAAATAAAAGAYQQGLGQPPGVGKSILLTRGSGGWLSWNGKPFALPTQQELMMTTDGATTTTTTGTSSTLIRPLFDEYPDLPRTLFKHISPEYDELGQVERSEVEHTVAPNVFAQMGVLDFSGVRDMCRGWLSLLPPPPRRRKEEEEDAEPQPLQTAKLPPPPPRAVFCDIGSGIGNVCLQVLTEVPSCRKVVGIEVIPSRHRMATSAWNMFQQLYPSLTGSSTSTSSSSSTSSPMSDSDLIQKQATFEQVNLVGCEKIMQREKVNVIFSHSWMFDDTLMAEFANVVNRSGPSLQCVITSRPFEAPAAAGAATAAAAAKPTHEGAVNHGGKSSLLSSEWRLEKQIGLSADWNPASPFFVYVKRNEDQGKTAAVEKI